MYLALYYSQYTLHHCLCMRYHHCWALHDVHDVHVRTCTPSTPSYIQSLIFSPSFSLSPSPLQPYLAELYEQYQTLKKNELLSYSVKSSFIEGFVVLKYVRTYTVVQVVYMISTVHVVFKYVRTYTMVVYILHVCTYIYSGLPWIHTYVRMYVCTLYMLYAWSMCVYVLLTNRHFYVGTYFVHVQCLNVCMCVYLSML